MGENKPLWNLTCEETFHWDDYKDEDPILKAYHAGDLLTAFLFFIFFGSTLVLNCFWVGVLSNKRYSPFIQPGSRYFFASLSFNGISFSVLVLASSLYVIVIKCWPFGDFICKLQAVIYESGNIHYVFLIIAIAVDRYLTITNIPRNYYDGKTIAIVLIVVSWIIFFGAYSSFVFSSQNYKLSTISFQTCVHVHLSKRNRIFNCCAIYFSPMLVSMYCYGTIFHRRVLLHQEPQERDSAESSPESVRRRIDYDTLKTGAATSLIFLIVATPWTVKEVFVAITGAEISENFNLLISWIGVSYVLWNPLAYWCLNDKFRQIASQVFTEDILCRRSDKYPYCCPNHVVHVPRTGKQNINDLNLVFQPPVLNAGPSNLTVLKSTNISTPLIL